MKEGWRGLFLAPERYARAFAALDTLAGGCGRREAFLCWRAKSGFFAGSLAGGLFRRLSLIVVRRFIIEAVRRLIFRAGRKG